MRRMRTAAISGVALAGVAGAAGWVTINGRSDPPAVAVVTTGSAPVQRADVAQRQLIDGTLGHSGTINVIASGQGTLTRLPGVGKVVSRGGTAYEVDGKKVVLMYGPRPVWRPFELGMPDGLDVLQLETNLSALGYSLTVDRHFSSATYWAVRRWQAAAHLTVTGAVPLGQIVFAPGAVRVGTTDLKLGTRVQSGAQVAHGTSAAQAVTLQVSPDDLPMLQVGDKVTVTLPDGGERPGRISEIGAIAANPEAGPDAPPDVPAQTAPVTVTMTGKVRRLLDQATVQVALTEEEHKGVLAVPISALRARPGHKYDVVLKAGGRHIPVEVGLYDENSSLVEVSGPGLAEGLHVEVPSDGS
jgi:peptidoglycan hydrolase-like protein with peptidoglycan-binding domain